jgi:phosphoglycolate phosphatase
MLRRYDLIVFDWDGTIMDSEATIVCCLAAAATDMGIDPPAIEVAREIIGLGMEEVAKVLFPAASATQRSLFIERFRSHYLQQDSTQVDFFPGVQTGLAELVERGYLLAVATGRPRRGLDRLLAQSGLAALFAASRCADECLSKPHPHMLQELLAQTGTAPNRTLMVGDTVYDMEMARTAGVDRLAVSYGVHDRARLLAHGPVACVNSFAELCRWLG